MTEQKVGGAKISLGCLSPSINFPSLGCTALMDASYQSFDLPSESESDVSEDGFSILPSLQTNKIGIKWSIGNKIALYDVKSRYDKPSVQSDASQAPTLVVGCSWNHARFARRLVSESQTVFMHAQKLRQAPELRLSDLVDLSHHYRSCVHTILSKLYLEGQNDAYLAAEVASFAAVEMIWHLGELMLLTKDPVLPGLLNWIQNKSPPSLDPSFNALLDKASQVSDPYDLGIELHAEYWPTIFAYIVRGATRPALALLTLHPLFEATEESSENIFMILKSLLEKMPMVQVDMLETDFETQWRQWKREVDAVLDSRQSLFINRPAELRMVFQILAGEPTAICAASSNWVITLIGLILYSQPMVRPHEIRPLLNTVDSLIEQRTSEYEHTHVLASTGAFASLSDQLDELVFSIFELDTEAIIDNLLQCDNAWFTAHFLDLFSLCDPTPFEYIDNDKRACTFHERALLDYVQELMTDRLPIKLLAEYLKCCPVHGAAQLAMLISREPIETEQYAYKLASLCQDFALNVGTFSPCSSIFQLLVTRRKQRGRYAAALPLATGSQAISLENNILKEVIKPITELDPTLLDYLKLQNKHDIIASFGDSKRLSVKTQKQKLDLIVAAIAPTPGVSSPAVQYLQLYAQTLAAYLENDLEEVLVLLGRSLGSELAPKRFWLNILLDCSTILCKLKAIRVGPIFSSSEVYDLMHCLEEGEKELATKQDAEISANIRLTLSVQLSEAILANQ